MTKALWERDDIQFPRLIAEIGACVNIDPNDWEQLMESMDLTGPELRQLFDRANVAWERIKAKGLRRRLRRKP